MSAKAAVPEAAAAVEPTPKKGVQQEKSQKRAVPAAVSLGGRRLATPASSAPHQMREEVRPTAAASKSCTSPVQRPSLAQQLQKVPKTQSTADLEAQAVEAKRAEVQKMRERNKRRMAASTAALPEGQDAAKEEAQTGGVNTRATAVCQEASGEVQGGGAAARPSPPQRQRSPPPPSSTPQRPLGALRSQQQQQRGAVEQRESIMAQAQATAIGVSAARARSPLQQGRNAKAPGATGSSSSGGPTRRPVTPEPAHQGSRGKVSPTDAKPSGRSRSTGPPQRPGLSSPSRSGSRTKPATSQKDAIAELRRALSAELSKQQPMAKKVLPQCRTSSPRPGKAKTPIEKPQASAKESEETATGGSERGVQLYLLRVFARAAVPCLGS